MEFMEATSCDENSDDGLQIVTESPSPKKSKKKIGSEEYQLLIAPIEKDLEENLEEKATKAHLTAINVKSIIKEVITNEDVVALVRHAVEHKDNEGLPIPYEPKYTRAKKKLLSMLQPEEQPQVSSSCTQNAPENVTNDVIDKCQETMDETQQEMEMNTTQQTDETLTHENKENVESCIPPDMTTDMYDMDCDDDVWREFLSTFTKPLDEVTKAPEDDEQDPEYNVLADEEIDEVDRREELRADRGVTISRKELNTLIAELVEFTDMYDSNKLEETSLKANEENTVEATPVTIQIAPLTTEDSAPECENASVTEQHVLLLTQQIRQHIQICTQNFLLSYEHPEFSDLAPSFKSMLTEFQRGAEGKVVSFYNAANLNSAIKLVEDWENLFLTQSPEAAECKQHFERNLVESLQAKKSMFYQETFPDPLMEIVVKSDAFLYPRLLPPMPYKSSKLREINRHNFESVDGIIALFLETAIPYLEQNPKNMSPGKNRVQYEVVAKHIQELFMPNVKVSAIVKNIQRKLSPTTPQNPIQFYFLHNRAPPTTHFVEQFDCNNIVPLYKRNLDLFSVQWREFIYTKYHHVPMELTEKIVTPINNHCSINANRMTSNNIVMIISSPVQVVPVKQIITARTREPPPGKVAIPRLTSNRLTSLMYPLEHSVSTEKTSAVCDMPVISQTISHNQNGKLKRRTRRKIIQNVQTTNQEKPSESVNHHNEINNCDLSEFLLFTSKKKESPQIKKDIPIRKSSRVAKKKSSWNSAMEQIRQKLKQEFIFNLVRSDTEEPQTKQQKAESDFFDKLRRRFTTQDYNKLIDILGQYDQNKFDFQDLFVKVQSLLFLKYKDFLDEFILFLLDIDARELGPLMNYFIMRDIDLFKRSLKTYLNDKPADFKKIVACLIEFLENRKTTIENVKSTVVPIIKENETLTEWFLMLLPRKRLPIILLDSSVHLSNKGSSHVTAKKKTGVNKTRKRKDPDEIRPLKKSAKRIKRDRKVSNRDECDSSSSPSKSITNLGELEEATMQKLDVSNEDKQKEVVEDAGELSDHTVSSLFSLHLESEPESVKSLSPSRRSSIGKLGEEGDETTISKQESALRIAASMDVDFEEQTPIVCKNTKSNGKPVFYTSTPAQTCNDDKSIDTDDKLLTNKLNNENTIIPTEERLLKKSSLTDAINNEDDENINVKQLNIPIEKKDETSRSPNEDYVSENVSLTNVIGKEPPLLDDEGVSINLNSKQGNEDNRYSPETSTKRKDDEKSSTHQKDTAVEPLVEDSEKTKSPNKESNISSVTDAIDDEDARTTPQKESSLNDAKSTMLESGCMNTNPSLNENTQNPMADGNAVKQMHRKGKIRKKGTKAAKQPQMSFKIRPKYLRKHKRGLKSQRRKLKKRDPPEGGEKEKNKIYSPSSSPERKNDEMKLSQDADTKEESTNRICEPASWTKEEDKVILRAYQQSTNEEETLNLLSDTLKNRTKEEIEIRVYKLMALVQEMMSKQS